MNENFQYASGGLVTGIYNIDCISDGFYKLPEEVEIYRLYSLNKLNEGIKPNIPNK